MKKSLILMLFVAFAFIGNAQNRNYVPEKFYDFEYEYYSGSGMRALLIPLSGLDWYRTVDLYIDGVYSKTFNIGNSFKEDLAMGFGVPVGSSWYLQTVRTVATLNGMGCMPRIFYTTRGTATNSTSEAIMVTVEY